MANLGEVTVQDVIKTNVVEKQAYRKVQLSTILKVAEYLIHSAGPNGSNTSLMKKIGEGDNDANTIYSKDGKTILEHIRFMDSIENSIVDELTNIAAHLVTIVGDGTTSVIVLASIIFKAFVEQEDTLHKKPFQVIRDFKKVAEQVKEKIRSKSKEVTIEDVYKIAMISTNGNEEVSQMIRDTYAKYGLQTHINLGYSNTEDTLIKPYNGVTLPMGYFDGMLINDIKDNTCVINKPRIYTFKDPVVDPLSMQYFEKIINANILEPATKDGNFIPTVIICPMLSRDLCPTLDKLSSIMKFLNNQGKQSTKPPILIVTDVVADDTYADIAEICGCRFISNYINPDKLKADIETGLAPSIENVTEWGYGTCDQIVATAAETKFINPKVMYQKDENGSYILDEEGNMIQTDTMKSKIMDLKSELDSLIRENAKQSKIIALRRRINTFEANMVDLLIGGIITTDREAAKHLAEDAILNCRSAIKDGFGYGANFEGLRAVKQLKDELGDDHELSYIVEILDGAYVQLLTDLYATCMTNEEAKEQVKVSIEKDMPINLNTLEYDGNVLSSIMTDQCILDSISKIVSIMFTANQAIVANPIYNVYR